MEALIRERERENVCVCICVFVSQRAIYLALVLITFGIDRREAIPQGNKIIKWNNTDTSNSQYYIIQETLRCYKSLYNASSFNKCPRYLPCQYPVLVMWLSYVRMVFHLLLRLLTIGGRSVHLAYLVHKIGRKTATFTFGDVTQTWPASRLNNLITHIPK